VSLVERCLQERPYAPILFTTQDTHALSVALASTCCHGTFYTVQCQLLHSLSDNLLVTWKCWPEMLAY